MNRKMKRALHRAMMILVAGLVLAAAGPAHAAQKDDKDNGKGAPPAASGTSDGGSAAPAASAAPANDPAYLIGAQDQLDINVWKEPDMSRSVPVRPDGRISLPLINDVQAAGLTPLQLSASLTDKLRKYLNNPQVTVIVTAMNSQRIFVVGEVVRAGAFPLIPGMTVLQALSSSGGFTTFADVKKIHVMRMRDGKQIDLPFNYRDVLKGDKPEQNIKLEPGDTIIVP